MGKQALLDTIQANTVDADPFVLDTGVKENDDSIVAELYADTPQYDTQDDSFNLNKVEANITTYGIKMWRTGRDVHFSGSITFNGLTITPGATLFNITNAGFEAEAVEPLRIIGRTLSGTILLLQVSGTTIKAANSFFSNNPVYFDGVYPSKL